jgi:hypothetical protein
MDRSPHTHNPSVVCSSPTRRTFLTSGVLLVGPVPVDSWQDLAITRHGHLERDRPGVVLTEAVDP